MKELEELVCSWEQGKQLVELSINEESIFKWVHPYQLYKYIENKRKYILVESYKSANRSSYPAYTLEELLRLLPEQYVLGHLRGRWFCVQDNSIMSIIYELTAIEACCNALVMWTLRETKKACYVHSGGAK